jgi:hypothetical protein
MSRRSDHHCTDATIVALRALGALIAVAVLACPYPAHAQQAIDAPAADATDAHDTIDRAVAAAAPDADWRWALRWLARTASEGGEIGARYVALAASWPPREREPRSSR